MRISDWSSDVCSSDLGESIEVHTIDCKTLESGVDADWVDLSWDRNSTGGTARLSVILKNEPGALAAVANIFGANKDRKSVVAGKSVSVRVDLGGRRIIKNKISKLLTPVYIYNL